MESEPAKSAEVVALDMESGVEAARLEFTSEKEQVVREVKEAVSTTVATQVETACQAYRFDWEREKIPIAKL